MLQKIFFKSAQRELRSGWQVFGFFLLAFIAILAVASITGLLQLIPLLNKKGNTSFIPLLLNSSASLVGALVASAVCVWRLADRPFASIGLARHRGWWRDLALGMLAALLMVSMVALMQWAAGGTKFQWHLATDPFSILHGIFLPFIIIFIAGCFEEVMFRGFPLQALAAEMPELLAAFITAVPFGLVHLGNPSASFFSTVNTVLAGIWLAVAYFKTRSLWLATGLHMGWNFALGVIYGLPVSGIFFFSNNSLLSSKENGHTWFTGGSYGPEGGASATLLLIVCTLWLYRTKLLQKSPQMAQYFADKEPPKIAAT